MYTTLVSGYVSAPRSAVYQAFLDADAIDVRIVQEGIPGKVPAADNETGTRMALANLARLVGAR